MVSVRAGMTSIFASRRSRIFINTPGSLSEHTQLLASALYGPRQGRSYSSPQFSHKLFGFKHILKPSARHISHHRDSKVSSLSQAQQRCGYILCFHQTCVMERFAFNRFWPRSQIPILHVYTSALAIVPRRAHVACMRACVCMLACAFALARRRASPRTHTHTHTDNLNLNSIKHTHRSMHRHARY